MLTANKLPIKELTQLDIWIALPLDVKQLAKKKKDSKTLIAFNPADMSLDLITSQDQLTLFQPQDILENQHISTRKLKRNENINEWK